MYILWEENIYCNRIFQSPVELMPYFISIKIKNVGLHFSIFFFMRMGIIEKYR